jgi:hypothetical protein
VWFAGVRYGAGRPIQMLENTDMSDQLKGTFGRNPQPKVFAQYGRSAVTQLLPPRADALGGVSEQLKGFAKPTVGKIIKQKEPGNETSTSFA